MIPTAEAIDLANHPEPWEQLEGENDKFFAGFMAYRDLGLRRTQKRTADALGVSQETICSWATRWRWRERIELYERNQDREYRLARLERRLKATEEIDMIAAAALGKVVQKLKMIADGQIDAMTVGEMTRLMEVASKLRLTVLGEPTERVVHEESNPEADAEEAGWESLTRQERHARIQALVAEAKARLSDEPS